MSRLPQLYARISPHIAHSRAAVLASRAHARVVSGSRGRVGRRLLGSDVLVVRSTGRRSGQLRSSPMFFVAHHDGFAVVASNAASERFPAWYLNLQAEPNAEVLVAGVWHQVRARPAEQFEVDELWPRFVASYVGYEHYRSIASRELPVLVLEPR